MEHNYRIFLDGVEIGTTALEHGDPPMGVAFGKIRFHDIQSPYSFFKAYCLSKGIDFTDYPEEKFISMRTTTNLVVRNENGVEIICSNNVSGMGADVFEIALEGIDGEFYAEEFPHLVKAYHDRFPPGE